MKFIKPTTITDAGGSYSRATTATYFDAAGVMQTAAINVPRIDHDPVTGESLGLLIEEARTNLLTYSEQFDNAIWLKAAISARGTTQICSSGQPMRKQIATGVSAG